MFPANFPGAKRPERGVWGGEAPPVNQREAPLKGGSGGANQRKTGRRNKNKHGTELPGVGPPFPRAPGKKYAVRATPLTPTFHIEI